MMTDQNSRFGGTTPIKIWRLYLVRFLLFFFAWGAVSLAFELPSLHLLLLAAGKAFVFSVFVLALFAASERLSRRTWGIALALLALLSALLVAEAWKGGTTRTQTPHAANETRR